MGESTGIAWTDSTFNPWIGCTKVGPGCDHCYAEALDKRHRWKGATHWGAGVERMRTAPSTWAKPLAWNKKPFWECANCGLRGEDKRGGQMEARRPVLCPSCGHNALKLASRRVFCASLADVFDNEVPEEWRLDLWDLIEKTPALTWLLLTKRIGNVAKMLPSGINDPRSTNYMPNVWIGASVVNQEEADRDIPKLLATPAAKRFVSYEPALGPIDFGAWIGPIQNIGGVEDDIYGRGLDQIIVGGESKQGKAQARPFDLAWARATIAQCRAAGVPVFVKQLGSNPIHSLWAAGKVKHPAGADPAEWPDDLRVQEFPA